ncbi:unnamed protein product, partial [Meganyctiphanes norvegica]
MSPLQAACKAGHLKVVQKLLDAGSNANTTDNYGKQIHPDTTVNEFYMEIIHAQFIWVMYSLKEYCAVYFSTYAKKLTPRYLHEYTPLCVPCGPTKYHLRPDDIYCFLSPNIEKISRQLRLKFVSYNLLLPTTNFRPTFPRLWCHDCRKPPKATCANHRVDNNSPNKPPTLGQQVDGAITTWGPSVNYVVETAQGWALVALDASCTTAVTVTEYLSPLATYIADWMGNLFR